MNNNPTSEKLTFLELIKKHKIEIPIIQRDYAQGREGKEELRNNFLNSLLVAVKGTPLELDFVYGSIIKSVFQPLDGQQRLTTLFLLHWFIALKENQLDNELKELLTKFTYETRTSSKEFSIDLINNGVVYNDEKNISDLIIDSSWFFLSWKRDPTIKSMLTMLDAIEQTFKNKTEVWDKLNNISFHYIELPNFGLSDDLYIKMNARGKALTPFENFKAKFEGHIEKNNWEPVEMKQSIENGFAFKLDQKYTDLFWSKKDDINTFDNIYLKFIAETVILNYAENSINKDEETKRIKELNDDFTQVSPENDFKETSSFKFLEQYLDVYIKYTSLTLDNLNGWDNLWKTTENELLKTFITKPTYNQRVLFYAQTCYLLKIGNITDNREQFLNWMRVIRNIVQNANIGNETFISVIQLIKELSDGCKDIYNHLSQDDLNLISNFSKEQVEQEVVKAKNIISFESQIKEIEDSNFFKGSVSFLFDNDDKFNIKYYEKVKLYFDDKGIREERKKDSVLIIQFLKAAEKYEFIEGTYSLDYRSENWKMISSQKQFMKSFQYFLLDQAKQEKFKPDWQNDIVNEVIDSGIIDYLIFESIQEVNITNHWGLLLLKVHNRKREDCKFVLKHIRNKFLLLKSEGVKCNNKIDSEKLKKPLFFGLNIPFEYNNHNYTWLVNDAGSKIKNSQNVWIDISSILEAKLEDSEKIEKIKELLK